MTKWRDVVRSGAGTTCTDEKESVAGKLKIRNFSNISRIEDALCQIFMNSVQTHSSYNNLAGTPTFQPFTSHMPFHAYFCFVLTYYLMLCESKCLVVLIPLSIVSILY